MYTIILHTHITFLHTVITLLPYTNQITYTVALHTWFSITKLTRKLIIIIKTIQTRQILHSGILLWRNGAIIRAGAPGIDLKRVRCCYTYQLLSCRVPYTLLALPYMALCIHKFISLHQRRTSDQRHLRGWRSITWAGHNGPRHTISTL